MANEIEHKPVTNHMCRICKADAVLEPGFGWLHKNGGAYVQICKKCGWKGSKQGSYQACPNCGEVVGLVDDHAIRV